MDDWLQRFVRGVAWALAVVAAGSCQLELEEDIACGDGYIDRAAGEECEPQLRSSYVNSCVGTSRPDGQAVCDVPSCTILNGVDECAVCGDGLVDDEIGEECDGQNLNGRRCAGGGEGMQCSAECTFDRSECEACGDGFVAEDEECDPTAVGGLVVPRPCAGAEGVPPLSSIDKPYASGTAITCGDDCRFDRTQCGYCGDGTRDEMPPVDPGISIPSEWCDINNSNSFDPDRLLEEEGVNDCAGGEAAERLNVGCGSDCLSFVLRPDAPPCCRRKGSACPSLVEDIRCCFDYDNPDEEPCQDLFDGPEVRRVCR